MTATKHIPKHAAARRASGPVTVAFRAIGTPRGRLGEFMLRAWPALPLPALIVPVAHRLLAVYADGVLGFDAMLCLLACLAVTPFMTASPQPWSARLHIARLRWWYGIWLFTLGFAALAVHLLNAGPFIPVPGLAQRVAGSATDWTGLLIVVLLAPMAATSSVLAQKALGPEWKRWQRWGIWAVTALVVIHLLLLMSWLSAAAFSAALVPLITLRVPRVRRAVKAWRAARYTTGGLWAILAILCIVFAAGLAVLAAEEGLAVARAVALAPVA
jgi:DMSO/TMAO reductase YedYZ heme-binding membrane subunit